MARIAGINIPQNKLVQIGLTYIYGIGDKFSKQICSSLEIPNKNLTDLRENKVLQMNKINFLNIYRKYEANGSYTDVMVF